MVGMGGGIQSIDFPLSLSSASGGGDMSLQHDPSRGVESPAGGQSLLEELGGVGEAPQPSSPAAAPQGRSDGAEAAARRSDLNMMMAAVRAANRREASRAASAETEGWEGLEELFTAAMNMGLADEHGVNTMKRNIERGKSAGRRDKNKKYTIPYYIELLCDSSSCNAFTLTSHTAHVAHNLSVVYRPARGKLARHRDQNRLLLMIS
eukprot:SAG11_NODE_2114_length_3798_cov_9.451473_2_plen_207_part_00